MEIKRKVAMYSSIGILLLIPICLFLYNKFMVKPNEILTKIADKKDAVVLIIEDDCKACEEVSDILDDSKVKYYEINNNDKVIYEELIRKLDLDGRYVKAPSLINIKSGKTYSYLLGIENEADVIAFISNYDLSSLE